MREITYSFIIPHKNRPDLLKRCIDSIPERDDIQIIVVDDDSDEDKKPYFERSEIEVINISKEESRGAGKARNIGLKKATGSWLLFPDCDDFYVAGFLDILDQYKDTENDLIYFNCEYRDGVTNELLTPLNFQQDFNSYDGSDDAKISVKFHHNVPWTKMIKCEYVNKYHFQFEEVINGNDIFFSMMVGYMADNIVVEKRPLYAYLRNENSLVTSKLTKESAYCKFIHIIKLNSFYDFVGHPEWKNSVIMGVLYFTKKTGPSFLFTLIRDSLKLYLSRKEWIKVAKGMKLKVNK